MPYPPDMNWPAFDRAYDGPSALDEEIANTAVDQVRRIRAALVLCQATIEAVGDPGVFIAGNGFDDVLQWLHDMTPAGDAAAEQRVYDEAIERAMESV